MRPLGNWLLTLVLWISSWIVCGLRRFWGASPTLPAFPGVAGRASLRAEAEAWKTEVALRSYPRGGGGQAKVAIQTGKHTFYVDLERLSECSQYFRALSQSRMRETEESFILLTHVPSSVFYNLLEFSFHSRCHVPVEELAEHIQVSSYLLAEAFLSKCLTILADELNPANCLSYLSLAEETCCSELRTTVFSYLSRNVLELSHLSRRLSCGERQEVLHMRVQGEPHLCSMRKENLKSWEDPETDRARHVFALMGSQHGQGDWRQLTQLPFGADKWCFSAAVLFNYLFVIGGHRQRGRRGWEFKLASFRYNPLTQRWADTAPLLKHRRHFSAVACDGCVYALGGWYLDTMVTPDCSTSLYTAVERYDPWEDEWRFVSPMPLTDFQFTVSMSHDVPLATSTGHRLYVLGSVQRTGEKLLLQYNTVQDSWTELLPTLTRADAHLPALYFLGAVDELMLVIGGSNSENLVTAFCLQSHRWRQVRRTQRMALVGQGTIVGEEVLMPSVEHGSVVGLDLHTLSLRVLPPLPIPTRYEAVFQLHF